MTTGELQEKYEALLVKAEEIIAEKDDMIRSLISGQETLQNYIAMTNHNATEVAYKNGYEAGVRDVVSRLGLADDQENVMWTHMISVDSIRDIKKSLIGDK